MSGSSSAFSLSSVFPVATSYPVGYKMENKNVGVKLGGTTLGIIFSRLRATTIDSRGDDMVQFKIRGETLGGGSGYLPHTKVERRAAADRFVTTDLVIPLPFLTIPKSIPQMTTGKKTETKVATLKGQEGELEFQNLILQTHIP